MKLATFNVNGINSRLPNLLEWLSRASPEVVCLQELKAPDNRFPAKALAEAGYGAIWQGQQSWNGVAILAKGTQPRELRRGLPEDGQGTAHVTAQDTQSRYLEAEVGGLIVCCLYLPNGNPQPGPRFDYKLAWFERLNAYARRLYRSKRPVALCGDFNVVPTDFDIYNPKSWRRDALLQPASREKYAALLKQGWVDTLRVLHPDERVYTFWDYFRNHWMRDSGLRIDHILLNPASAPMLRSVSVDRWVRGQPHASDHAPMIVELQAQPARSRPMTKGKARKAVAKKTKAKKANARKATATKGKAKKATLRQQRG